MPADEPTELSRIKLKNLNSTARPYDQQAFSPLDLIANWLSQLALAIVKKALQTDGRTDRRTEPFIELLGRS